MLARLLAAIQDVVQPFRARPTPAPPIDPVAEALRQRIDRQGHRHAKRKVLQEELGRHTEWLLWRGHMPIDGGRI